MEVLELARRDLWIGVGLGSVDRQSIEREQVMAGDVVEGTVGPDAFECQRGLNMAHISDLFDGSGGFSAFLREDANFGPRSVTVLNEFKARNGLPADGVADPPVRMLLTSALPPDPALPEGDVVFGVPSGQFLRGFTPAGHGGVDVTVSGGGGGGVDDPRRGAPIFATLQEFVSREALNSVICYDGSLGLGFDVGDDAVLVDAVVVAQPWSSLDDSSYGGILGLAAHYDFDGGANAFTVYVEYEHLITPEFPPKDGSGAIARVDVYAAGGRGIGFGARMAGTATLTADVLAQWPTIGFLGATQTPHVHVQARFAQGRVGYLGRDAALVDPSVVVSPVSVVVAG